MRKFILTLCAILITACGASTPSLQPQSRQAPPQQACPTAVSTPTPQVDISKKNTGEPAHPPPHYRVTVTCDLQKAIAAGHYDKVSEGFTKSSPANVNCTEGKEVNVELFNLYWGERLSKTLDVLARQGYRPATGPELMALGAKFPELQNQAPIVGLGTIWKEEAPYGLASVPVLRSAKNLRRLDLYYIGEHLSQDARMAVLPMNGYAAYSRAIPPAKIVAGPFPVKTQCSYPLAVDAGKYKNNPADYLGNGTLGLRPFGWENIPNEGCVQNQAVEISLFKFDKLGSMEDTIKELNRQGYRGATWPELLALGAKYPKLHRKTLIYGLGTQYATGQNFPYKVPGLSFQMVTPTKSERIYDFFYPAEFVETWGDVPPPIFAAVRDPTLTQSK